MPRKPKLLLFAAWVALAPACTGDDSGPDTCSGAKCDGVGETGDSPAVQLSVESATVTRDYQIDEPAADNAFTTRYRNVGRHSIELSLLKIENAHGLALYFIIEGTAVDAGRAPYGARLYRATLDGRDLLYRNGDGKVSPNWGPRDAHGGDIIGWVGLGGAEAAFPVDEHGYYSAVGWDYRLDENADGSATFTASTVGDPRGDGSQRLAVEVAYTVPTDGGYFRTAVAVVNPDAADKSYQYWHNYMLPAGRFDDRHDVEVLLPEVDEIEVHSTGDDALKLPGSLSDGGHSRHPFVAGGKVSRVHGPQDAASAATHVQGWLGFFAGDGRVSRYGFFNHDTGLGLGMSSVDGTATIFPKAFGGAGIGPENWSAEGSRYVEMWYSINTRTFWESGGLGPNEELRHETLVFPLTSPAELDAFDPQHPADHRPESGAIDTEIVEEFDGPAVDISDGTTTGTHDADWSVWYDGDRWGGGHTVTLGAGEQEIGLDNGSFGIERSFGNIGGGTLTVDHSFGGDGWYEVLAGDDLLVKHETATDGIESFALPVGATSIRFKVGSMGSGFHRATIRRVTIQP